MTPARLAPLEIRASFLLFFALYFFFLLTSTGRVRTIDEISVDFQTESFALHGTTAVPQAVQSGLFYGKLDLAGQPRTPYGAGQAIMVLPWYYTGRLLRSVLPGIPGASRDAFLDAVVTSSSAAFSALAASLLFLIFCRSGITGGTALWASLIFALATPIFAYSAWFFSEPLVSLALLAASLFLFTGESPDPISPKSAAIAGLLLGLALWIRPTHVIAAPVFLLAVLLRDRRKSLAALVTLAGVVGIFGGAYLLRNQMYFGSLLDFGYPLVAEGGKQIITFDTPLATGLFGYLVSPGKSVFLFAPPILLAIPGIFRLAKRNMGLAVIAGVTPVLYLFFFARYTQWEGGYCVGPRYMVPAISLLSLGLGPMLSDAGPRIRALAKLLLASGLFVQLISIATSFLEDQARGAYYDQQWNYRMNYSSILSQSRLLIHYLSSPGPARIGLGFDRWFVFLAKTGVAHGLLAAGLVIEGLGFVVFAWLLKASVSEMRVHLPKP
jgi:hypothetical protein